jgi:hypothetical protein
MTATTDREMIEALEHAIHAQIGGERVDANDAACAALRALAATDPGLAAYLRGEAMIVPKEATEEMWQAFFVAKNETFPKQRDAARAKRDGWQGLPAVIWSALLAASPFAPKETPHA